MPETNGGRASLRHLQPRTDNVAAGSNEERLLQWRRQQADRYMAMSNAQPQQHPNDLSLLHQGRMPRPPFQQHQSSAQVGRLDQTAGNAAKQSVSSDGKTYSQPGASPDQQQKNDSWGGRNNPVIIDDPLCNIGHREPVSIQPQTGKSNFPVKRQSLSEYKKKKMDEFLQKLEKLKLTDDKIGESIPETSSSAQSQEESVQRDGSWQEKALCQQIEANLKRLYPDLQSGEDEIKITVFTSQGAVTSHSAVAFRIIRPRTKGSPLPQQEMIAGDPKPKPTRIEALSGLIAHTANLITGRDQLFHSTSGTRPEPKNPKAPETPDRDSSGSGKTCGGSKRRKLSNSAWAYVPSTGGRLRELEATKDLESQDSSRSFQPINRRKRSGSR